MRTKVPHGGKQVRNNAGGEQSTLRAAKAKPKRRAVGARKEKIMSKKFLLKVLVALCFVAVAVVWLLSAIGVIEVNLAWLIAAFAFALAVIFIVYGLAAKTLGVVKKFYIIFGAVLAVAGVLALVGTIIEDKLVLPIIAIIITVGMLLCILAVGGKKWDQGDNEVAGYKDYRTRKKEEEEAKRRAEEENNDDKNV